MIKFSSFTRLIVSFSTLIMLSNCAQQNPQPAPQVVFPVMDQLQAEYDEKNANYHSALQYWKQTANIVSNKITVISEKLHTLSEQHALKGIEYYKERKTRKAAVQFLKALKCDPANSVALDYMLNKYKPTRTIKYRVKPNDSFEKIANEVYGSPTEAFIIPIFSSIKDKSDLLSGSTIILPALYSFVSQPHKTYKVNIVRARNYYKKEKYEDVIPLARMILKDHKRDKEASFLLNSSLVRLAEIAKKELRYQNAMDYLSEVSPSFRKTAPQIKELKELISSQQRYKKKLDNDKLLKEGIKLYGQEKYNEAYQVFLQIDPTYENVQTMIIRTRQKLNKLAEIHHKKGVEYYLKEKLEMAIKEWEQALEYNPTLKSTLDYLNKTQDILNQIKKID